ncbi:hypothetical protein EVAR_95363_1 [Eumeta japonica]|uniref:Uncharacterized protein n=1 Tax=Eumeta variegata TaxID=151549 RepID=A0A4C1U9A4_EUMVA|nr:hypothetical protein EVAR_95363_1 [Eumeta japonica]
MSHCRRLLFIGNGLPPRRREEWQWAMSSVPSLWSAPRPPRRAARRPGARTGLESFKSRIVEITQRRRLVLRARRPRRRASWDRESDAIAKIPYVYGRSKTSEKY